MISKIDAQTIEPTSSNVSNLVEKYNILVELYGMAVHCQLKYQDLYESNFEECRILKEHNTTLLVQANKIHEFNKIRL